MFNRIDHIGIAVEEIDPALELWRDRLELRTSHREVFEDMGVEAVLLGVGDDHIELVAPLGPDTPVGKFLAKRGPGIHHVAYQVSDIDATLAALKAVGIRSIDEQPRAGLRSSRVVFLHPKTMGGVLMELVEPAASSEEQPLAVASGEKH